MVNRYNQEKLGMRSIRFKFSALRPVRVLMAICACVFLVFSSAAPALSDTPQPKAAPSAPQQGEANLTSIEKEAQKAAMDDPYSRKDTQVKANEGLNEIQGAADADKMSRPENAQATSVEEKSKSFLEALTGKK